MERSEMRRMVEKITSLPTLPGSVTRITRMLDNPEATAGEDIQLSGLLGYQRGLALGGHQHGGAEGKPCGHACHKGEHYKRLMPRQVVVRTQVWVRSWIPA